MWHISVTSFYNATNDASTICFNIILLLYNIVCCVFIISFITSITIANGICSTCGILLNSLLLWIHRLLFFIWVTNNNGITLIMPQSITSRNIEVLIVAFCIIMQACDLRSNYTCTNQFVRCSSIRCTRASYATDINVWSTVLLLLHCNN